MYIYCIYIYNAYIARVNCMCMRCNRYFLIKECPIFKTIEQ